MPPARSTGGRATAHAHSILAEKGVELRIPPDGPMVRVEGALSLPAVPHLGAAAASAWMLSACDDLEGLSPIQAIKAGDTRRKSEHAWRRYSTREFSLVRALRADPLALGIHYIDLSTGDAVLQPSRPTPSCGTKI